MLEKAVTLATDPGTYAALATLIAMEVVLGIDNLVFISIVTGKLPQEQQARARRLGIGLAVLVRLLLLASVAIIVRLTQPVFSVLGHGFSWRDLILLGGGLFLLWKATREIHERIDPHDKDHAGNARPDLTMGRAVGQILMLDIIFSLDSIITAVGMVDEIAIMVIAVLVAVGVMLAAAEPLSRFVNQNPSVIMLALSFLVMIGMTLVAEAFHAHVSKGYVYAAMAFSVSVEVLNLLSRRAERRRIAT